MIYRHVYSVRDKVRYPSNITRRLPFKHDTISYLKLNIRFVRNWNYSEKILLKWIKYVKICYLRWTNYDCEFTIPYVRRWGKTLWGNPHGSYIWCSDVHAEQALNIFKHSTLFNASRKYYIKLCLMTLVLLTTFAKAYIILKKEQFKL